MIDERARDMDTDYNMRGYSDLWAHTHTTLGGLYLRQHIFSFLPFFLGLYSARMFLFACSFSIYHLPISRSCFFNVVNVISSYLSIALTVPLQHLMNCLDRTSERLRSSSCSLLSFLSGSLLLLFCTTLGLFLCCRAVTMTRRFAGRYLVTDSSPSINCSQ